MCLILCCGSMIAVKGFGYPALPLAPNFPVIPSTLRSETILILKYIKVVFNWDKVLKYDKVQ